MSGTVVGLRAVAAAVPSSRASVAVPPPIATDRWSNVLNESRGWVEEHCPRFESAESDLDLAYYYRWRLFHLHLSRAPAAPAVPGCTSGGCHVITEFIRKVPWSGPGNTIVCPAGHHIAEGRWVREKTYVDDYARFWMRGPGWKKQYTFWPAHALWRRALLTDVEPGGPGTLVHELLPYLVDNYHDWIRTHFDARAGCMFQSCHADGQENSVALDGCRPTINAVMHAEASALQRAARAAGNASLAKYFKGEASKWRQVLLSKLWSDELSSFAVLAQPPPQALHAEIRKYRDKKKNDQQVRTYFGCLACPRGRTCPPERGWPNGKLVPVRELASLSSPWYFGAVPADPPATSRRFAAAFAQLHDPGGFGAKWGPTTTERRGKCFNFTNGAQCNWNGPVWPFETAKVATALAELLQAHPAQPYAGIATFESLVLTYARAHTRASAEGRLPPHIDEDLHPDDGYWITRRKLHGVAPWAGAGGLGAKNGKDYLARRGDHYFHSSFNDIVLSAVAGIRPTHRYLEVRPLTTLQWWSVRGARVRGHSVDVTWDSTGGRYAGAPGLHLWVDGELVLSAPPCSVNKGRQK